MGVASLTGRVLLVCALLLGLGAGEARADYGQVQWDWQRGVVTVRVGKAGSLRSPTRALARVRAARLAEEEGRERLAKALASTPWAGAAPEGWSGDDALHAELVAKVAWTENVDYGSDGSVVSSVVVPIDSLRGAAYGPDRPPAATEGAPAPLIIDATKLSIQPGVGLEIEAQGQRYRGPTLWFRSAKDARADARVGADVTPVSASSSSKGRILLDDKDVDLTSLRAHSTLVIVLWTPSKKAGTP